MMSSKVMVVDDSPTELTILRMKLEEEGFYVIPLTDPERAVDIAIAEKPDFIILDVFMPNMSGFQVCASLKASDSTRDIPIMVVTSSGDLDDVSRTVRLGCVEFFPKPFELEKIVCALKHHELAKDLRALMKPAREVLTRVAAKYG